MEECDAVNPNAHKDCQNGADQDEKPLDQSHVRTQPPRGKSASHASARAGRPELTIYLRTTIAIMSPATH